ncbi:MAG: FHA domain-containing protein, partial [Pseudobdellovibrionaceae bacterium]
LFFEIIEGPSQGKKCRITPGLQIGRSKGDFLVNDPKISSLHAQVEQDAKGNLLLVDTGSSNGIVINQQKVRQIKIMRGVVFRLGKTAFKIVESDTFDPISLALMGHETGHAFLRHKLQEQVLALGDPFVSLKTSNVYPFRYPMRMTFIQGIQAEEDWILGFGPRKAGSAQLDLFLKDPAAPDLAFELIPEKGGVNFRTFFPEIVKVNGDSLSSCTLHDDDVIEIGITRIQINFLTI